MNSSCRKSDAKPPRCGSLAEECVDEIMELVEVYAKHWSEVDGWSGRCRNTSVLCAAYKARDSLQAAIERLAAATEPSTTRRLTPERLRQYISDVVRSSHMHYVQLTPAEARECLDWNEAYLNMREWAEQNGLDTHTYGGQVRTAKEPPEGAA